MGRLRPPTMEIWEISGDENASRVSMHLIRLEGPEMPTCDVYWGSHGCDLMQGHKGRHVCRRDPDPEDDSGICCYPYYRFGTFFYGDDAPRFQPAARVRRIYSAVRSLGNKNGRSRAKWAAKRFTCEHFGHRWNDGRPYGTTELLRTCLRCERLTRFPKP